MSWFTRSGLGLLISAATFLSQAQPVQACFFPWLTGGYGGGYGYGAPAYGGYYAGYSPMWSAPPMGYYSAGYAPLAYGCAPACCNPCATGCGTGTCGAGGCGIVGCGTGDCTPTSSDSLKPAADPAFRSKSETSEPAAGDTDPAPTNRYERDRDPLDGFSTPNRSGDPAGATDDRWDSSGTRRAPATDPLGSGAGTGVPAGGTSGTGAAGVPDDGLFGEDALDRKSNRPPMTDPLPPVGSGDAPAGVQEPKTETPFLEPDPKPGVSTEVPRPEDQIAVGSQLREVIPAARLAGRSLNRTATQYSARDNGRPIRWISLPGDASQVRL